MRNMIIGICSVVFLLLIILVGSTVFGRNARQTELDNALNTSMKNALETLDSDRNYIPKTNDELVSVFTQLFLQEIDSKSDATVEVLDVDVQKKLLSAKATLTYNHLNGKKGTLTSTKTIVMEQSKNLNGFVTVNYTWTDTDPETGAAYGKSTTFHNYQDKSLSVKDSAKTWKLAAATGIKDSNESSDESTYEDVKSVDFKDAAGNKVTLKVGESYSCDTLSKIKIDNVDAYSSLSFTQN